MNKAESKSKGSGFPSWLAVHGLSIVAVTLVVLVVVSIFVISFDSLSELAEYGNISETVAWLWPVAVDGTILAATVVYFVAGKRDPDLKTFTMGTLISFAIVSILGNVAHGLLADAGAEVAWFIRSALIVFINLVPPVGLLLTVHILASLMTTRRKDAEVVVEAAGTAIQSEPVLAVAPVHDAPIAVHEPSTFGPVEPTQPAHEPVAVSEPLKSEPLEPVSADGPFHVIEPVNQAAGHMDHAEASAAEAGTDDAPQDQPRAFEPVAQELPQTEAALSDGVELGDPAEPAISSDDSEPVASASVQVATATVQPVRAASELSTEERTAVVAQARELISDGLSMRAASEEVGIPRATLSRWFKAAEDADQANEPLARVTSLHAVND